MTLRSHGLCARPSAGLALAAPALALGLAALGGMGCGKKKAEGPPQAVVECKPFCDKTFETCGREVFIASGKLRVDKAKLFKVLGLLKKVKAEGLERCRKNCDEHQGVFGDAKAVNECMKIADCEPFAACITKYIK
jgi:hypothetical protein